MAGDQKFTIPNGETVRVRIIDTTSRIELVPSTFLMEPIVPGFTHMPKLPSWSFLVEHGPTGKKVLFDLGVPPDWKSMSPATTDHTIAAGWKVSAEKNTVQILEENGISGQEINSIIWRFVSFNGCQSSVLNIHTTTDSIRSQSLALGSFRRPFHISF